MSRCKAVIMLIRGRGEIRVSPRKTPRSEKKTGAAACFELKGSVKQPTKSLKSPRAPTT